MPPVPSLLRLVGMIAMLTLTVGFAPAAAMPVTPDAAECTVAPRSLASLVTLAATPAATVPGDDLPAELPESALPSGSAVAAAIETEIGAAARLYVACVNAWDLTRLLALRSDADVRRAFGDEGPLTAAEYVEMATPFPASGDMAASLLAVRGIRGFADGRVGAIVEIRHPHGDGQWHDTANLFVYVRSPSGWLLDDAVQIVSR